MKIEKLESIFSVRWVLNIRGVRYTLRQWLSDLGIGHFELSDLDLPPPKRK